ncbi:MAG: hypothetical protein J3K34DRAFT_185096 [Monoraphidium minutum]|nr:MAG: hypothetical protein J3K34DRAFT_185096 [Monoraphidium minutum]
MGRGGAGRASGARGRGRLPDRATGAAPQATGRGLGAGRRCSAPRIGLVLGGVGWGGVGWGAARPAPGEWVRVGRGAGSRGQYSRGAPRHMRLATKTESRRRPCAACRGGSPNGLAAGPLPPGMKHRSHERNIAAAHGAPARCAGRLAPTHDAHEGRARAVSREKGEKGPPPAAAAARGGRALAGRARWHAS